MRIGRISFLLYGAGLILGLGLVVVGGAVEISSTPTFCGSCHVMKPYYESWVSSSHSDIACVDCHISPGLSASLRKKFEASAMVTRYFTGTYSTNPWAEVDDAACLQCHERRLLGGKISFDSVFFDHEPHLSEVQGGIKLRCTSCHSQIVQGSHIAVAASNCILCHFKTPEGDAAHMHGAARNSNASAAFQSQGKMKKCTLCHAIPDGVVRSGEREFEHGDVSMLGMDCRSCHRLPSPQDGRVPLERCLTCHNEPEDIDSYGHTEELHRIHTTAHKVDCMTCHLEIEHDSPMQRDGFEGDCALCHRDGHTAARKIYAGSGGKQVAEQPDVMHRAGVVCEGCHIDMGHAEETRAAGVLSCMNCHGPEYRKIYKLWTDTIEERLRLVERDLNTTIRDLGMPTSPMIADARWNLNLVEKGKGVHNYSYSLDLIEAAHSMINQARVSRKRAKLEKPWPVAPYSSRCFDCHAGIESGEHRVFEQNFSHERHVVEAAIECDSCHRGYGDQHSNRDLRPPSMTRESCLACHHEATQGRECLDCHGDLSARTFETEIGEFKHSIHVEEMELSCRECHGESSSLQASARRSTCAQCHE